MRIENKYDRLILQTLQKVGRITNQDLAATVSLSPTPCWRRVNKLEEEGVIEGYAALLNRQQLGLSVLAYIHVSLRDHNTDTVEQFNLLVDKEESILECYSMSGEYDYLMRVVAEDVVSLEAFLMERLLNLDAVRSANTSFVLKEKKYTTALPLPEQQS